MLSYTDLKKGTLFEMDGDVYEVLESNFSRMQQRKAVVQSKVRNLATGKIYERSFQASDAFPEAAVEKRSLLFLYEHRGEFVFCDSADHRERFPLRKETLGERTRWLKSNAEVTAIFFQGRILRVSLPIKMDFTVTDAPPGVQGDRSQSGTKAVTIETGVTIQAPLFIRTGDVIRINTETGAYVERVEKG